MNDPTDLLERLPERDVSPQVAQRIQDRVHALATRRRPLRATTRAAAWAHYYHRFVEPGVLVGLGLCQLLWALHGTWVVFHP